MTPKNGSTSATRPAKITISGSLERERISRNTQNVIPSQSAAKKALRTAIAMTERFDNRFASNSSFQLHV